MKTRTILILGLLLSSCAPQIEFIEYIQIYKRPKTGDQTACYLTLKSRDNEYDAYVGGAEGGTLGNFEIKGDTLRLTPRLKYGSLVTKSDSDVSSAPIPRLLMIKRNRLIDITDYTKYPEPAPLIHENAGINDFTKIKFRKSGLWYFDSDTFPEP